MIILSLKHTKINYSNDYIFAILNLNNFAPLLFLANNMFTMFFILEVNSTILFYKFIMSNIWYNNENVNTRQSKNNLNSGNSQNYTNVLFFQY